MIYKKNPDFVPRKIAGELILIPLQRQIEQIKSIYSLNQTACAFWELIDGSKNRDQIGKELLTLFDVDEVTLNADLDPVIRQLEEIKAIQPA